MNERAAPEIESALSLIQPKGVNKKARFWAHIGRVSGFAFTIYANLLHSGWQSTDHMLVNAIPAFSLIVIIELLVHSAHGTTAGRKATPRSKGNGRHLQAV